jgi:hypothetical protein
MVQYSLCMVVLIGQ